MAACALLAAHRGLAAHGRRRMAHKIHDLIRAGPVLRAARLSLPVLGEKSFDAWAGAGGVLVEQLRDPAGVTDLLLERVYQMYLPLFFCLIFFIFCNPSMLCNILVVERSVDILQNG